MRRIAKFLSDHATSGIIVTARQVAATTAEIAAPLRGQDGNIALMSAVTMVAVIGVGSFAVDAGSLSNNRRDLQAAADVAAMAAVMPLLQSQTTDQSISVARLQSIVASSLASNGFASATIDSVVPGTYCPNPAVPASSRFTAGGASCDSGPYASGPVINAVQIAVHDTSPLYLARMLLPGKTNETIPATSTAVGIDEGGFTAGTGLVSVDTSTSPVLNAVLGGMLGTQVNLSAVSYQGLANAQIDGLSFLNALAPSMNAKVGTFSSLASGSAGLGSVLHAESTVLAQPGSVGSASASSALTSLAADVTGSPSVAVGSLLNAGAWQTDAIGAAASPTALQASLNAFSIATAAIQLANGQHAVDVPTAGLNIPGLTSLTVSATAVSPKQSVYAGAGLGSVGATMSTSQVDINAGLSVTPPTLSLTPLLTASLSLSLPASVSLANGTASLASLDCGASPATDSTMTVMAQTSAATIDVAGSGQITITLAGLPVLKASFQLSANTQVGSGGPTALTFTQADITNQTSQRVSSSDLLSTSVNSLTQSLSSSASNQISVAVLGVSIPGLSSALLSQIVAQATSNIGTLMQALDPVVNGTAAALGVQVGYMDVTATGVRCGVPAIIN